MATAIATSIFVLMTIPVPAFLIVGQLIVNHAQPADGGNRRRKVAREPPHEGKRNGRGQAHDGAEFSVSAKPTVDPDRDTHAASNLKESHTACMPPSLNRYLKVSSGFAGHSSGYKCGRSGKVRHSAPSASPQALASSSTCFQRESMEFQSGVKVAKFGSAGTMSTA